MKRKGQYTGFSIIIIGLVLFTLPALFTQGINDFGLAATTGIGEAASFPPWENRTIEETNINYTDGSIAIEDGSKSAVYTTEELTNEPDEFELIQVDYDTTIYESDSEITLNLTVTNGGTFETRTLTLENGSNTIDLDERIKGEDLTLSSELSRISSNDPSPEFNSLDIGVKTIDNSHESQVWQRMLKLAVITFSIITMLLLFDS